MSQNPQLDDQTVETIRELFKQQDANGDGFLTVEEIFKFMGKENSVQHVPSLACSTSQSDNPHDL
jgi:hypothetical protein